MERGKYVETRRGEAAALGKRRLRRFRLSIDQQLQSKNIGDADAVAFQLAVAAQLDKFGASAFTGSVFLQLEFTTASKTPPAIYKLPKKLSENQAFAFRFPARRSMRRIMLT